jgi:hypothetical protein
MSSGYYVTEMVVTQSRREGVREAIEYVDIMRDKNSIANLDRLSRPYARALTNIAPITNRNPAAMWKN